MSATDLPREATGPTLTAESVKMFRDAVAAVVRAGGPDQLIPCDQLLRLCDSHEALRASLLDSQRDGRTESVRVLPENFWREVWHDGCARRGMMIERKERITIEDGSVLRLWECLMCGARCFAGLNAKRVIVTRPSESRAPSSGVTLTAEAVSEIRSQAKRTLEFGTRPYDKFLNQRILDLCDTIIDLRANLVASPSPEDRR